MGFEKAYRGVRAWYIWSIGMLVLTVAFAILGMAYELSATEGFIADYIWYARVVFMLWAAIGLAVPVYVSRQPSKTKFSWPRDASPEVQQWAGLAIVRLAFSDAIGVYGLLLFLYSGQVLDLLIFATASFVALAWHFPKCGDEEQIRREARLPDTFAD